MLRGLRLHLPAVRPRQSRIENPLGVVFDSGDDMSIDLEDFDEKRAKEPATKFELYKAVMLLRSLIADVYIHDLASSANDHSTRSKASAGFGSTSQKLDALCDSLISKKTKATLNDG